MKTKKILIAVLTAALVTAFMIGCSIPLEDTNLEIVKVKEQPAPDGKIKIKLNVGNSVSTARTVRPNTGYYDDLDKFPYYLLFIFDDDTGFDVPITDPTFISYFESTDFDTDLTIGTTSTTTFTFILIACSANDGTEDYLAWGMDSKKITGSNDFVNIVLHGIAGDIPSDYDQFNGKGEFAWNLNVAAYPTANLTLYPISDPSSPALNNFDLKTSGNHISSKPNIDSGYYRMILELGETGKQTVYVQEIVHIYSSFTTTYTTPTLGFPTLRVNRYTITYNYGTDNTSGDLGNTRPTSAYIQHGVLFNTVAPTTPPNSIPARYEFDRWCYDSGLTEPVENERAFADQTLYANWLKIPAVGDYYISQNLTQTTDALSDVTVVRIVGDTSTGGVTVKYDGSTIRPSAVGSYPVTFDVAAVPHAWKAASGLSAGTLTIGPPQDPAVAHYSIGNTPQNLTAGPVTAVTVNRVGSHSPGEISNIQYYGISGTPYPKSTTPPQIPGTFQISFDVAAAPGWNATTITHTTHLIVTARFFGVSIDWDTGDPEIDDTDSKAEYKANNTLEVYIKLSEMAGASTIYWYSDSGHSSPLTNNAANNDEFMYTFDRDTECDWWQGGAFTIYFLTNKNQSGAYRFTPTPVGP